MSELPTSQAFLEQSALLLQAYPDTRITTKYSFPTTTPSAKRKRAKSEARKHAQPKPKTETEPPSTESTESTTQETTTPTAAAPVAALVLKTYNPTAGICLKYRTNKVAEVGRLITGLGKLAAGADLASLGSSGTVGLGEVEMVDVGGEQESAAAVAAAQVKPQGQGQGQGQGGKGKKKGGKGKR